MKRDELCSMWNGESTRDLLTWFTIGMPGTLSLTWSSGVCRVLAGLHQHGEQFLCLFILLWLCRLHALRFPCIMQIRGQGSKVTCHQNKGAFEHGLQLITPHVQEQSINVGCKILSNFNVNKHDTNQKKNLKSRFDIKTNRQNELIKTLWQTKQLLFANFVQTDNSCKNEYSLFSDIHWLAYTLKKEQRWVIEKERTTFH